MFSSPSVLSTAGALLTIATCAFRMWAIGAMGRMFTFDLRITERHRLVTSGPYSVVRHPSYTGLMGVSLGILLCMVADDSWLRQCHGTVPAIARGYACIFVAYYGWLSLMFVKRTAVEDAMMKQTFGKQWEEWRDNVKYRLIPGVY
jgi:protein-S-isoprenylcysteine O-methyltransferase Ste14